MIPELNQPVRIASLECGSGKFPCLKERFPSKLIMACMTLIARSAGGRLRTLCFLFSRAIVLAITLVRKHPLVRCLDAPVLSWNIDLTQAKDLPRNFRTTNDPLKVNEGSDALLTPNSILYA